MELVGPVLIVYKNDQAGLLPSTHTHTHADTHHALDRGILLQGYR